MSDCSRHGHLRTERQKSCSETTSYSSSSSSSPGCSKECSNGVKGIGKRYARRAKRWAELQNRRSGTGSGQRNSGPPEPPRVCDFVELARMGSGILQTNESSHFYLPSAGRRSLPFSILQPRRQEYQVYYPSYEQQNQPVYVTRRTNDCGQRNYISVYQAPPELTVYPVQNSIFSTGNKIDRSSLLLSEPSSPESLDTLSLLTADLGATSISSPSSSLSTSFSSQEAEDFLPYSRVRHLSSDYHVNTHPPPDRNWVMIRHADPDRAIATFTVLCYNVLCDKYATVNQYSYCPSWALNWEYRKVNIMKEIRNYEADIITLQEVETEQFHLLFQPELKSLGYSGIFSPKSRAKTMSEEERKYVDGCAIFWKADKFEMEKQHLIEFTSLVMKKASSSEHMLNRVMPRDNIALCAVLKIRENVYPNRRVGMNATDNVVGSPLVVCTAHIHWDPEFCDVKLVQTMMLAHELYKLVEEVAEQFHITTQQTPVLICGDLNSLPDSGVFEFLSRGKVFRGHQDLKGFRDDNTLEKFSSSCDPTNLMHNLRLESAVDQNTIPFTNYTLEFKGMIDYIFSTPQSLARLGILGSFEQSWIANNKILGFPHPHVPSDHVPIMAQYAIIPTSHQRNHPPVHNPHNSMMTMGFQR